MGKSSSGKDTLYKEIREMFPELRTVTLYTTRPVREGERDGVEYFFVTPDTLHEYKKEGKVLFVGDGVNDAPVLKISDIGVSMGQVGSDAAIEASDMVIMKDDLSKIETAIKIASYTKKKVTQTIIFSLLVKFAILTLGAYGISTLWMAVFADVGVTFLCILNVLTIMFKKF